MIGIQIKEPRAVPERTSVHLPSRMEDAGATTKGNSEGICGLKGES